MEKDLSNYRKSYNKDELLLDNTPDNPFVLFKDWFKEVDVNFPAYETNAMTIATIGLDGFPKNRVVLLKKYNSKGFIFYTNYKSEKGQAILNNPNVSLSFFWHAAERQVIIKGKAKKITAKQSDRPRGSQLGAVVSNQSEQIDSREELEQALKALKTLHKGKTIKRPKHWGGFIVNPIEIEFWQGRPNRLHDYRSSVDI